MTEETELCDLNERLLSLHSLATMLKDRLLKGDVMPNADGIDDARRLARFQIVHADKLATIITAFVPVAT